MASCGVTVDITGDITTDCKFTRVLSPYPSSEGTARRHSSLATLVAMPLYPAEAVDVARTGVWTFTHGGGTVAVRS